jgi:vacuolar-type H+-ATPase subunit B/Vma2
MAAISIWKEGPLFNAGISFRYAEIVNVRLGDNSLRKGQVLEIAGKRAVVQVSKPPPPFL